jgi:2-haloacid dehalogenase
LLLQLWFATVLQTGIALSASGGFATFREIACNVIKQMMAKSGALQNADEASADVIQGFNEVQAHPDVLPGLHAIHQAGIQVTVQGLKSVPDSLSPY